MAVLTLAAVVCVAVRRPSNVPEMMRSVWRPEVIAVTVMVVLLAYPIWMMLAGPQHITGSTFSTMNPYHNDLFSFVAPGPLQRVSLGMRSLGNRLATGSGAAEADGYIGVPLLILTGVLAWRSRRSPRMQLATVLLLVSALLSLGPRLAIDGRPTGVPLPFMLLDHLPLVDNLLPSRFSFEMAACLAAVIAFGLDDLHRSSARSHRHGTARRVWGGAAFAVITLAALIGTQLPEWPNQLGPTPALALPTSIRQAIPAGDPVAITYPYATGNTSEPMLWQADDQFGFRLLGGYGYHQVQPGIDPSILSPSVMNPPQLQQFLAGLNPPSGYGPPLPVTPELVSSTRATVSKYHIRLVIVDRSVAGSSAVMELFNDALGPPRTSAHQLSLFAGWHGTPIRQVFQVFLFTRVLLPANGSALSGTTVFIAEATDYLPVTRVEFLLRDASHNSTTIGIARPSLLGWIAKWNTASVANGTYALQSVAYDGAGISSQSADTTITVNN